MNGLMRAELLGLPLPILIAGGGVAGAVLLVGMAIRSLIARDSRSRQITQSLAKRGLGKQAIKRQGPHASVRRRENTTGSVLVDALVKRITPRPELMAQRLERTGRDIVLGRYVVFCASLSLVWSALILVLVGQPVLTSCLIGLLLGVGLPHLVIGFLIRRRMGRFIAMFPDAIDLIVRGLRSGLPVTESIKTVVTEIPAPVGQEFGRIADTLALGKTLDEAMWESASRMDIPEFRFFVISLSVQRETGGNLAETLENLGDVLRKRRQTKLKIKALASEAKASAIIIGSLPFIMFAILYTVNKDYVMFLIEDSRGHILLAIGLAWLGTGFAAMAKMVRFEV